MGRHICNHKLCLPERNRTRHYILHLLANLQCFKTAGFDNEREIQTPANSVLPSSYSSSIIHENEFSILTHKVIFHSYNFKREV